MNDNDKTVALLKADQLRMVYLKAARQANLPDWYLGAGFLRNAIWDHLHQKPKMTPLNDVDLVYYDAGDTSRQAEQDIERVLSDLCPDVDWEVRNQARMHERHGHAPYADTSHGIAQWVEVPTCVGVRLEADDRLTLTAPFGLAENWSLAVRINPNNPRSEIFRQRIENKHWLEIWPKLVIKASNEL